jgi:hypothetical protein
MAYERRTGWLNAIPKQAVQQRGKTLPAVQAMKARVTRLQQPVDNIICYLVLCGEWPLLALHDGAECLVCFTRRSDAGRFLPRFRSCFCGGDTLALLAIRHPAELWAALHLRARSASDRPCGLIVDLSYESERFYSPEYIVRLGPYFSRMGKYTLRDSAAAATRTSSITQPRSAM